MYSLYAAQSFDVEDGPIGYVSFCHPTVKELALAVSIQADYFFAHCCLWIFTGIPADFTLEITSGAFDCGLILRAIFDV